MEFDLNEELAEQAATKEIWLKRLAWILGVLIVMGAIGYGMKGLFAGGEPKKKEYYQNNAQRFAASAATPTSTTKRAA